MTEKQRRTKIMTGLNTAFAEMDSIIRVGLNGIPETLSLELRKDGFIENERILSVNSRCREFIENYIKINYDIKPASIHWNNTGMLFWAYDKNERLF